MKTFTYEKISEIPISEMDLMLHDNLFSLFKMSYKYVGTIEQNIICIILFVYKWQYYYN